MEEVTKKLLEECSLGCKMAINSMNQVSSHVNTAQMEQVIDHYKRKHEQLEKRADELLGKAGEEGKEPGLAASAMSWITAEVKLKMHNDDSQISKLMMDGCNMGIQSVSGCINEYSAASGESLQLARELVQTEEEFMKELKEFL